MTKFNSQICFNCKTCELVNTEECNEYCPHYFAINWLVERSNIPQSKRKFHNLIPSESDVDNFARLNYVKDNVYPFVLRGNNLYLWSNNTQNGKTSWTINILLAYLQTVSPMDINEFKGVFVNVPSFLQRCKDNMNNYDSGFDYFKSRVRMADLVIWDDIATNATLSSYDSNVLSTHLAERHLNGKSNIYTGNVSGQLLENVLGKQLSTCIKRAGTHVIKLNGEAYKNNDFFADFK